MKKRIYIVFLMSLASTWVFGQVSPCNCTANVASGNVNFSTLTWTGTGCPTAGSSSYSGNLCVNLANGSNLIMNKNFTIAGGFGISNSGNSTFTLPASFTLNVSGNMGDNSNNNVSFAINGNLNVGGTLFGKNGNGFSGSGSITAGGLNFKGEPTCASCAINWNVTTCSPQPSNFCDNIVLPVTLLFFEAHTFPEYVQLDWATASELNFDRFVIEKTRNGIDYSEIGSVQGAGVSTSRIDYSFTDEQIMLGRTYYRLKAIDFDGYTEYFGVVSAYYEGVDDISIFPNPAPKGNVNINFNYFSEAPMRYKVLDISGAEVDTGMITRSGFDNTFTLTKAFSAGSYFLVVSDESNEKKVIRFIVL